VKSKIFIKFCEKFEGFWFEFDLKRIELKKSLEKEKRKKESGQLTFQPSSPLSFPAAARAPLFPFLFLFPSLADAPAPPFSLFLFSFLPFTLLCFARSSALAIPAAPGRLPSPSYPPEPAN
jgi:hypothetical protein